MSDFLKHFTLAALTSFVWLPLTPAKESSAKCRVAKMCADIDRAHQAASKAPQDEKVFQKLVKKLEAATQEECKIPGIQAPIPAYRACYDGGFSTRTNKHGKVYQDKTFPGPFNEDHVAGWFTFLDDSKFPAGRQFTRGKLFHSTLDGWWAERFSDLPEDP